MPVCLLAACVCACHSEDVWVRMSVCHVERVSMSVYVRPRVRVHMCVCVAASVGAMCQDWVCDTDKLGPRQRN